MRYYFKVEAPIPDADSAAIHCGAADQIIKYIGIEPAADGNIITSEWCDGQRWCGDTGKLCSGNLYEGAVMAQIDPVTGSNESVVSFIDDTVSSLDLSHGEIYLRIFTYGNGYDKPPTAYHDYKILSVDNATQLTVETEIASGVYGVAIWDLHCPDVKNIKGGAHPHDYGSPDEITDYNACREAFPETCPKDNQWSNPGGGTFTLPSLDTNYVLLLVKKNIGNFNCQPVLLINGLEMFTLTGASDQYAVACKPGDTVTVRCGSYCNTAGQVVAYLYPFKHPS